MTDDERDQIRESVDIGELIGEDVGLRRRGGRLWGLCPFHEERTPSFAVDPARGSYHCFGCQAHGDVFEYVMRTRGVAFPEAAGLLADRAGIVLSKPRRRGIARGRIAEVLEAAASHMREALLDTERPDARAARSWLGEHGIGGDATGRWGIGLAPGGGEVCKALRASGFADAELRAAGILGGRGDVIHHALCVPLRNGSGGVVGLVGQAVGATTRVSVTPSTGRLRARPVGAATEGGVAPFTRYALFGMEESRGAIRGSGSAVVTLGPIDAIALHESGVANVVSTIGGGLGPRQARELEAAGAREASLLFPDDGGAGTRAAVASLPAALAVTMRVSWGPTAPGAAGEVASGAARSPGAPELVDRVLGRVAGQGDMADPNRLLDGAREACALLAPATGGDPIRACLLAEEVARRFGIRDPDTLMGPLLGSGPIGDESWREAGARGRAGDGVRERALEHRAISLRANAPRACLRREVGEAVRTAAHERAGEPRAAERSAGQAWRRGPRATH